MNGKTLLQRSVYIAYAVTAFTMPFVTAPSIPLGHTYVQVADLVFALTAALWLVGWARGQFRLVGGNAWWAMVAYAVFAAASVLTSPSKSRWLVHFLAFGYLAAICMVTASLASDAAGRRIVLWSWIAGAAVTIGLGLFSVLMFYTGIRDPGTNIFLWNYGTIPVGDYPRIGVFFRNANMLCSYLLVSLVAIALLWSESEGQRKRYLAGLFVAGCVATVFTLSAGLGGLTLGFAVGWWLWQRYQGTFRLNRELLVLAGGAAPAVGLLVLSVILMVPAGQGDLNAGPVDIQLVRSGRVETWSTAWASFAEKPLTGVGLGEYPSKVMNARAVTSMEKWKPGMTLAKPAPMEAHNVWLSIMGRLGLPGILAFVAWLALLLKGLLPPRAGAPLQLDTTTQPATNHSAFARVALFSGIVGAVFYHGWFGSLEEARQYWFLFGLVLAYRAWPATSKVKAEQPAIKPALGVG